MTDVAFIASAEIQHVPLTASPQIPDAVARACDPQLPAPAQPRPCRSLPPGVLRRLYRVQQLLAHTDLPLSEVAIACGFADQGHCSRRFKRRLGITPPRFRWLRWVARMLAP